MESNQQRPIDQSYSFGGKAYIPANRQDRKPKHEKIAIQTYEEYRAYLEKIGLKEKALADRKKADEYTQLFDRYGIPEAERHYVFLSDLKKMD